MIEINLIVLSEYTYTSIVSHILNGLGFLILDWELLGL